jgi:O-antigen ligase
MRSVVAAFQGRMRGPGVLWLLVLELVCIGGFVLSVVRGWTTLAAVFLLGPLQLLVWVVAARDDRLVLLYAAFMTPFAMADFVPRAYHRFVLYPGTIALLVAVRLAWFASGRRQPYPKLSSSERIPSLILIVWLLIAFLLAVRRGWWSMHLFNFNVFALEILALSYCFAVMPSSLRDVRNSIVALVAASALVVFLLPFLPEQGEGGILMGGKRLATPYGLLDMNALGAVVGSIAAALIGFTSGEGGRRAKTVPILAALVLMGALAVTRSRGAWLGFGFALLYVLMRARSVWLTTMLAGGGAVVLASGILRRLLLVRLEATTASDPSLLGRLLLWSTAWEAFRRNWLFGVGWENFRVVKVHYGWPRIPGEVMPYNTHNIYLEVLVDLGIVGLVCFLWFLAGIILRTDRLVQNRQGESSSIALALNAAIIVFAVHGLLDCLTNAFVLFAIWLGLAMCVRRLASSPADGPALSGTTSRASG